MPSSPSGPDQAPPRLESRAEAKRLDATDPLAGLRERFHLPEPDLIYLDGNSLGRLPLATRGRIAQVVDQEWGAGLVRSWEHWLDEGQRIGDRLAQHVLGARPGEVTVGDNTTVNLYKLAAAALDHRPDRPVVITDRDNFPTDRYVLQGLAEARGGQLELLDSDIDQGLDLEHLRSALARHHGRVALVSLSLVSYRSGALLDLAAVNDLVHQAGALVLWDLSHAAGAVRIDLTGTGTDLAVGCTYKYLCAGPGAPAYLYVRRELQKQLVQPIHGWYGQRDQFAMGERYQPQPDIRRFLTGTPSMVAMAGIEPALDLVATAGIDRLQAKSRALTAALADLVARRLSPLGVRIASPLAAERRGGHLTVEHPDAAALHRALLSEAGVLADLREPSRLRFAPTALYNRFVEVWDTVERFEKLLRG